MTEPERSQEARAAAEAALVTVAYHFGAVPPFVLLGGLVPALLCRQSTVEHAGTTDIDVHVDLLVHATASAELPALEDALVTSGFSPDKERVWRWKTRTGSGTNTEIKFEVLTDSETDAAGEMIAFAGCARLGAANLRGTRFASQDVEQHQLSAVVEGLVRTQTLNVTSIAGFLMAKLAAAHSRRKAKDWYDIAYVLLHNDYGRPADVAALVDNKFPAAFTGEPGTWLRDLVGNFGDDASQGAQAYADQMVLAKPEELFVTHLADARLAVEEFASRFLEPQASAAPVN